MKKNHRISFRASNRLKQNLEDEFSNSNFEKFSDFIRDKLSPSL